MTSRERIDLGQRAEAAPRTIAGMPLEKALAWGLRCLAQVAWILLLIIAWQIRDRMSQIDKSLGTLSKQLGALARTVEIDGRTSAGLAATVQQHEVRIGGLETRVATVEVMGRP